MCGGVQGCHLGTTNWYEEVFAVASNHTHLPLPITHIHTHGCVCMCTHTHKCTHTQMHIHTHTQMHIHTHTNAHTHTHTNAHTHAHTQTHTHTHKRTHTNTYTHTHTHTPAPEFSGMIQLIPCSQAVVDKARAHIQHGVNLSAVCKRALMVCACLNPHTCTMMLCIC